MEETQIQYLPSVQVTIQLNMTAMVLPFRRARYFPTRTVLKIHHTTICSKDTENKDDTHILKELPYDGQTQRQVHLITWFIIREKCYCPFTSNTLADPSKHGD